MVAEITNNGTGTSMNAGRKPCTRNYNDGNAHSVRIRNGSAICVTCSFPIGEHGKAQQ